MNEQVAENRNKSLRTTSALHSFKIESDALTRSIHILVDFATGAEARERKKSKCNFKMPIPFGKVV